jgi:hypothetical protein
VREWTPGPNSPDADPDSPNYVLQAALLLDKYPDYRLGIPMEVEWMVENPGQQGRLTGSFHPLEGGDWTQQAYARWVAMVAMMSKSFRRSRGGSQALYSTYWGEMAWLKNATFMGLPVGLEWMTKAPWAAGAADRQPPPARGRGLGATSICEVGGRVV